MKDGEKMPPFIVCYTLERYEETKMIRNFQQSDMEQVITIWLEASIQAHDFVAREFWESKSIDMRETYIPSSETYVYEEDGIIKGFIALYNNTVAALFISPSHQRHGIGSQLIAKSKEIRSKLELTVYKENHNSTTFYKKCGFKIMHEQIDTHTGYPELFMVFP
ncbi:GNAT family N-acetyltransferase [Halodesulfovibrio aestuarii]|uniref:GNAT family N-acetyltransferase n=1 Tax=Halodesulfovibrio aestuarii TaxID=126333 RepID=UPI003D338DB7